MTKQEMIDEIMDYFDFERVELTMEALDWTWARKGKPDEIPTVPELRQEARRLLREVAGTPPPCGLSCGGFMARNKTFGSEKVLSLSFVVEEWDATDREEIEK